MFSPSAENLDMPVRLPAAPRSRWAKSPVLAMWADQSPATRARSSSQSSAARPRARRSALSRLNRSLASFWAVVWLPAGAGAAAGAVVGGGSGSVVVVAGLVVVVAAVVVVVAAVVVVVRRGRRSVASAALASGTLASSSVTQRQSTLVAPTPRALKERLRIRRLAVVEAIRPWWAASTLAAQRTCSLQARAGWTASASPTLDDRRRAAAIRADWAPARADRRGTTRRAGRPCRERSALTSEARRMVSGAGAADAARS